MTNLNARQEQILKLLEGCDGFQSAAALSRALGCSVKTVYNDLDAIRAYLEEKNLGTLEAKPHEGLRLVLTNPGQGIGLSEHPAWPPPFESENGRALWAAQLLLKEERLTVSRLEKRLYISRGQARKILEKARAWLAAEGVPVTSGLRQGLSAQIPEFRFRMILWKLFCEESNLALQSVSDAGFSVVARQTMLLESFLEGFDSDGVKKAILALEERFQFQFSYGAYVQTLFFLSLAVLRIRRGRMLKEMPADFLRIPPSPYEGELAGALAKDLSGFYQVPVSRTEQEFFRMVMEIADIQCFLQEWAKTDFFESHIQLWKLNCRMIFLIGDSLQTDLRGDSAWEQGLLLAVRSMTGWMRVGLHLPNPQALAVKRRYPETFAAVWSCGFLLEEELGAAFSMEEISDIVVYIENARERQMGPVTAAVICHYGIGFSQMLREKIERSLLNLRITGVFTARDAWLIRKDPCDFLISTIPLPSPYCGKEVVLVDNFFTAFDPSRIEAKIESLCRKTSGSLQKSEAGKRLFSAERILLRPEAGRKEEIIHALCGLLERDGCVREGFENSVLEREDQSSTLAAEGMALPHGNSSFVKQPAIAVAVLKPPLLWDTKAEREADILFLLAFTKENQPQMQPLIKCFYTFFASLCGDRAKLERVRNMDDPSALADFLNDSMG